MQHNPRDLGNSSQKKTFPKGPNEVGVYEFLDKNKLKTKAYNKMLNNAVSSYSNQHFY